MNIKNVIRQGDAVIFEFDDKMGMEYPNPQSVIDMIADFNADDLIKRKTAISKWVAENPDVLGGG